MMRRKTRPRLDWDEARERLARAMRGDAAMPADRARQIMDERARRLAEPATDIRRSGASFEALVFSVGRARYALSTRFVREVAPLAQFTSVPGASDLLYGVANHHGDVLPILQPRALLAADTPEGEARWLVVCGERHVEFALLVDAVHELRRIHEDEALAPLEPPGPGAGDYVRGMTGDALLLLDGAALLAGARVRIGQNST